MLVEHLQEGLGDFEVSTDTVHRAQSLRQHMIFLHNDVRTIRRFLNTKEHSKSSAMLKLYSIKAYFECNSKGVEQDAAFLLEF